MESRVEPSILRTGEVIDKQWKVIGRIGEGTFSQIYSAKSLKDSTRVAVKVERPGPLKPVLEWESYVLKSLQSSPLVCRYYYNGQVFVRDQTEGCVDLIVYCRKHNENTVLVMELLGDSMSKLRHNVDASNGLDMSICLSVSRQMLDCIEDFHNGGYVHRDIKASNFVRSQVKGNRGRDYYIIDFGLSRQILTPEGKVIPARKRAEFRGTSMYASLQSHRNQDLGRVDDLWSWIFLVVDFIRGELPWVHDAMVKNKAKVEKLKEHFIEKHPEQLVEGVRGKSGLLRMLNYLKTLKYADKPDYDYLRGILKEMKDDAIEKENDSERASNSPRGGELEDEVKKRMAEWTVENISKLNVAKDWCQLAKKVLEDDSDLCLLKQLLGAARKMNFFFDIKDSEDTHFETQYQVYRMEQRIERMKLAPPPMIQTFGQKRKIDSQRRFAALKRRREEDSRVRESIDKLLVPKEDKKLNVGNGTSAKEKEKEKESLLEIAAQEGSFQGHFRGNFEEESMSTSSSSPSSPIADNTPSSAVTQQNVHSQQYPIHGGGNIPAPNYLHQDGNVRHAQLQYSIPDANSARGKNILPRPLPGPQYNAGIPASFRTHN